MNKIYTIGHSLTAPKVFIQKLQEYKIDVLVDVRTTPYSSRARQFNREILSRFLGNAGIEYVYKGKNLGGLGENVDFDKTIDEVFQLSKEKNIAVMCSEGDYKKCHRFTTLTPEFERKGGIIEHICWEKAKADSQTSLFV